MSNQLQIEDQDEILESLAGMVKGDKLARSFQIGKGARKWEVRDDVVDMVPSIMPPLGMLIEAKPQWIRIDARRTALMVVDMQNDFCEKGGWVDENGFDLNAERAPIKPLQELLPVIRRAGMPVIWLNWGNRPDLLNMAPNQLHVLNKNGNGIGFGDELPHTHGAVMQKDSWSAEVVDELEQLPQDIKVDKYRISGFWDTQLDSILRNLDIRTILFAGVNTDQCVSSTLQDASFLGYSCVLVADCCSTLSPKFCIKATIRNIVNCYGFVTESGAVIDSIEGLFG